MQSKVDENLSKADENHKTLMAMLAKCLDKKLQMEEEWSGVNSTK